MCGWVWLPHCGQVVRATGAAFQFARRERVLEREVFRFGTATSGPLLWVLVPGVSGLGEHPAQGGPPRVDRVVVMVRVLREQGPALGTQARAVLSAYRLERQ